MKKNTRLGIILMILCALCLCSGQFIWKCFPGPVALLTGFAIYGVGALSMLCAYNFGDLSTLQPINSVSYIISTMLGGVILRERVSWMTILGILCIMGGVVMLARGGEEK